MAIAGIIGGLGPESTLEYYRLIHAAWRERRPDGSAPLLLINSLDMKPIVALVTASRLEELADALSVEVERLARAGADFGAISANTPHLVFDALRERSPIPLISIVEATARAAAARGMKRVGILGTSFTMKARFYPEVLARAGIALVTPSPPEQEYVHETYMNELVNGIVEDVTRMRLHAVIDRMKAEEGIEGVILGGTELSLILRRGDHEGMPLLDTSRIHVAEIVDRLIALSC
jgi:aspartate racemase